MEIMIWIFVITTLILISYNVFKVVKSYPRLAEARKKLVEAKEELKNIDAKLADMGKKIAAKAKIEE